MLNKFEGGKLTRRQLVLSLAALTVVVQSAEMEKRCPTVSIRRAYSRNSSCAIMGSKSAREFNFLTA